MDERRTTASSGTLEKPEKHGRRGIAASAGAVAAALVASLCCIGPVLFVTLGIGAGMATRFEPLRTVDGSCVVPRNKTRDKVLLWMATVVALVLLTFPQWSVVLL